MRIPILVILVCFLASCSESDIYSCDPDVNAWVTDNLTEIHKMTRSEWIDLDDIAVQRGSYVAFTSEQKHQLWIAKFDEILNLKWTAEERAHLLQLTNAIKNNPVWFDANCSEKERDQRNYSNIVG